MSGWPLMKYVLWLQTLATKVSTQCILHFAPLGLSSGRRQDYPSMRRKVNAE